MKKRFTLMILVLAVALSARAEAQVQGIRFKGVVVDQDGNPVVGAEVTAEAIAAEASMKGSAKSKKGGRYGLFVMQVARQYRFTVTKDGYQELVQDFNAGSAITNEQMRIEANFTLVKDGGVAQDADAGEVPGPVEGNAAAIRLYNAGATANNEGDRATAIEKFREAVAADPGFVTGYQALLGLYIQAGDFANTLEVADQLIEVAPTDSMGLGARYDALLELGRTDEAEAALERMILAVPGPPTAVRLFNRAATALRENNMEKAIPDLKRALEMDPDLAVARSALATAHLIRKEYQPAAENAEFLRDLKPDDAAALSILYEAYRGLGDAEKAKEAFTALQQISPERAAEAFYNQGVALLDQGKPVDALASFEKVLASNPGHVKVHYMLGLCYLNSSDMAKAKSSLEKFIEMAPDDRDAPSAREMLAALQ
ncbi:MAG: tetratricopeptide repeat protein [bacterium]|nr:tetratricopeptide repeat protein [bacterium]